MKKIITILIILGGLFFVLNSYIYNEKQEKTFADYKDAEYLIEGELVNIRDGYFGNELKTDLDADGDEDVAFIITHSRGGSGTFYYAVAALNTGDGFVGSDGYFLGDRIAPQSTTLSPNERHKNVVVFNYADRAVNEPMTAVPSVGKSVYLKISPESRRWGIVLPDFEGESR